MKLIMNAKSVDIFGQKISLNFGKKGNTFNTPYGIIVSLMIFTIVGLYSGVRMNVLVNF